MLGLWLWTVGVFILVLDLLDVSKTAPWMPSLVTVDLGSQTLVEFLKVPTIEACDGLQILEKLNSPVAWVVLCLILDVVASLAVPCTHTNVFWNDLEGSLNMEIAGQRRKEAVDEVLGVRVQSRKASHRGGLMRLFRLR